MGDIVVVPLGGRVAPELEGLPTCALRERRSVADFDLHEPAFCETHGRELRAALASR